jgi:lipoate-protein ligase A
MRVLTGRAGTIAADHAVTNSLLTAPVEPTVRVWQPYRHVAFGPRDAWTDGYDRACAIAEEQGYPVRERSVGGRAVAYTGTTICFALVDTVADERAGVTDRYDRLVDQLLVALDALGVDAARGEPAGAFCPGSHSLSASGKLVGLAQRVRRQAALTAGILVPRDRDALVAVLEPLYAALSIPFDPDAVGSVRRAGSDADPATIRQAVEDALVAGHQPDPAAVERVHVSAV